MHFCQKSIVKAVQVLKHVNSGTMELVTTMRATAPPTVRPPLQCATAIGRLVWHTENGSETERKTQVTGIYSLRLRFAHRGLKRTLPGLNTPPVRYALRWRQNPLLPVQVFFRSAFLQTFHCFPFQSKSFIYKTMNVQTYWSKHPLEPLLDVDPQ